MVRQLRSKLTYANVMATIAVFLALGGGAYAAFHLPKNSVRSRNIKNGQVRAPDLGATRFHGVNLLANPGGLQYCAGASNEWTAVTPDTWGRVGYRRDLEGWVHLSGVPQQCGNPPANRIFTLPPGYRPAFSQEDGTTDVFHYTFTSVGIGSDGTVLEAQPHDLDAPSLAGLSFRCGPSGKHGCP
jgi:hypothetical protein